MLRLGIILACASLVVGCEAGGGSLSGLFSISRQQPTQSMADIRGHVFTGRLFLWRNQPMVNVNLAIPVADNAYLWRACVRATMQDAKGASVDRAFLVIQYPNGHFPEFDSGNVASVCQGLQYSPFAELEKGFVQERSAGKPKR